jgi:hypothetical protein
MLNSRPSDIDDDLAHPILVIGIEGKRLGGSIERIAMRDRTGKVDAIQLGRANRLIIGAQVRTADAVAIDPQLGGRWVDFKCSTHVDDLHRGRASGDSLLSGCR